MRTKFIEHFDITGLTPADYNPRKIESEKIEKLKESISKFGMIKPVIINGKNDILTAGHQRIKASLAVGLKTVPVIQLESVDRYSEIMFNLFHNSIETNKCKVKVNGVLPLGYCVVPPEDIEVLEKGNATVVKQIGDLILAHGEWGSVVCDEDGNVFLNADYAYACSLLKKELLCYVVENSRVEELMEYLSIDYGEYYYEQLGVATTNQMYCQPHRPPERTNKKQNRDFAYELVALPNIDKTTRMLDFGAGECNTAREMRKKGYKISMYEPNYRKKGTTALDLQQVVRFIHEIELDVKSNGLYDAVLLGSVLNSVISVKVEHDVLASCAGLLKPDGKLFVCTRNLANVDARLKFKTCTGNAQQIEFLDKNNFIVAYQDGLWTMQHYHSMESLEKVLSEYFEDVNVFAPKGENAGYIFATAQYKKPIDRDKLEDALTCEFNIEYAGGYQHNKHGNLVKKVLELNGY